MAYPIDFSALRAQLFFKYPSGVPQAPPASGPSSSQSHTSHHHRQRQEQPQVVQPYPSNRTPHVNPAPTTQPTSQRNQHLDVPESQQVSHLSAQITHASTQSTRVIQDQWAQLQLAKHELAKRERRVLQLEARTWLQAKETEQLLNPDATRNQSDALLKQIVTMMADKEHEVLVREKSIIEREQTVAQREQTVSQLNEAVSRGLKTLSQREQLVADREREVSRREQQLRGTLTSAAPVKTPTEPRPHSSHTALAPQRLPFPMNASVTPSARRSLPASPSMQRPPSIHMMTASPLTSSHTLGNLRSSFDEAHIRKRSLGNHIASAPSALFSVNRPTTPLSAPPQPLRSFMFPSPQISSLPQTNRNNLALLGAKDGRPLPDGAHVSYPRKKQKLNVYEMLDIPRPKAQPLSWSPRLSAVLSHSSLPPSDSPPYASTSRGIIDLTDSPMDVDALQPSPSSTSMAISTPKSAHSLAALVPPEVDLPAGALCRRQDDRPSSQPIQQPTPPRESLLHSSAPDLRLAEAPVFSAGPSKAAHNPSFVLPEVLEDRTSENPPGASAASIGKSPETVPPRVVPPTQKVENYQTDGVLHDDGVGRAGEVNRGENASPSQPVKEGCISSNDEQFASEVEVKHEFSAKDEALRSSTAGNSLYRPHLVIKTEELSMQQGSADASETCSTTALLPPCAQPSPHDTSHAPSPSDGPITSGGRLPSSSSAPSNHSATPNAHSSCGGPSELPLADYVRNSMEQQKHSLVEAKASTPNQAFGRSQIPADHKPFIEDLASAKHINSPKPDDEGNATTHSRSTKMLESGTSTGHETQAAVEERFAIMNKQESQPTAEVQPTENKKPQSHGPTGRGARTLSISHMGLLYDMQAGGGMKCRLCRSRKIYPPTTSWTDLIAHSKETHAAACAEIQSMSSAKIAEMKQRLKTSGGAFADFLSNTS